MAQGTFVLVLPLVFTFALVGAVPAFAAQTVTGTIRVQSVTDTSSPTCPRFGYFSFTTSTDCQYRNDLDATINLKLVRTAASGDATCDVLNSRCWADAGSTWTLTNLTENSTWTHYHYPVLQPDGSFADVPCEYNRTTDGSGGSGTGLPFLALKSGSQAQHDLDVAGDALGTRVRLWVLTSGSLVRESETVTPSGCISSPRDTPSQVTRIPNAVHDVGCPNTASEIGGVTKPIANRTDAFEIDFNCSIVFATAPDGGTRNVTVTVTGSAMASACGSDPVPPVSSDAGVGGSGGTCEPLKANAGTYGPVVRADTINLDGSASTGDVKSWKWRFAPGLNCPSNTPLKESAKTGAKISLVPLCNVLATLTVTDGDGHMASDTTAIRVQPRPFQAAKVTHAEQAVARGRLDPRTPKTMTAPAQPGEPPTGDAGINVSECSKEKLTIQCPYDPRPGRGYTLKAVTDPGGPFDGFWFVDSATLSIQRLALINPTLLPGAPRLGRQPNFYNKNVELLGKPTVDEFLAMVSAHEGEGVPGRPDTGHTGRMREKIASNPQEFDPNISLEDFWRPTQALATRDAAVEVAATEIALKEAADDPLPMIWGPDTLYFWNGKRWIDSVLTVPGQ